jgi:hypothetical protein
VVVRMRWSWEAGNEAAQVAPKRSIAICRLSRVHQKSISK